MTKIFSVADDFQFSVNIDYDLGNDDKLKNFIPTNAAMNFLQEIFFSLNKNSTNRARILIGAYCRGKSHIVLTALSLLLKKDLNLFAKLLPKLEKNPELHQLVKNFYANSEKILPVIINGTATNLNQSFLSALQRTLTDLNAELKNLSKKLNRRADILGIAHDEKFRNLNGMKCIFQNVRYFATDGETGLSNGNKLQGEVVDLYFNHRKFFDKILKNFNDLYS